MFNLFVAIVLDNFEESDKLAGAPVQPADIEEFKHAWDQLDMNANGLIHWKLCERLLYLLGEPLGLKPGSRRIHFLKMLRYLDIT